MAARTADGRGDELTAREAVAISLDDGQRLVSEHEQRLALRRDPEQTFRNLAVRAAHAHFERPDEDFALACRHGRNVFDARCVRVTWLRYEREHLVPLPEMPPSFWVASTKPEAGTKASLTTPAVGGCAGFAGTTVPYCWKGHLGRRESAVDHEDATGDEARCIRGEVGDCLRDLLRCPQPA
jgi:hypothetical protein